MNYLKTLYEATAVNVKIFFAFTIIIIYTILDMRK